MNKKPIYLIIIIIIIAACSFAGGYLSYKSNNSKENNTTNEEHLPSNAEGNYNENVNESNTSKNESSKESSSSSSSKSSSKSSQSSKKTTSSSSKASSKQEKRIVYLDVYHRTDCGFCNELLKFLNNLDPETKEQMVIRKHDVTKEYDKFQAAINKYGNNKELGVPYVVFNNEKTLTGYSKDLEKKYKSYINEYIK